MELVLFALFKAFGVFIHSIKNLLIIKSTKLQASVFSGINSIISITIVKLVVDIDTMIACIIAFFTHSVGCYLAMLFFEKKVLLKDVTKALDSSIMDIDAAITHCCKIAIQHKCDKCGENHAQLAVWLKELKELKKLRKQKN